MKPGMLSLADGVGWTYTYCNQSSNASSRNVSMSMKKGKLTLLFENSNLTPRPELA